MADFRCPECGSGGLIVAPTDMGGWKVMCRRSHELFPFPGRVLATPETNELERRSA